MLERILMSSKSSDRKAEPRFILDEVDSATHTRSHAIEINDSQQDKALPAKQKHKHSFEDYRKIKQKLDQKEDQSKADSSS